MLAYGNSVLLRLYNGVLITSTAGLTETFNCLAYLVTAAIRSTLYKSYHQATTKLTTKIIPSMAGSPACGLMLSGLFIMVMQVHLRA